MAFDPLGVGLVLARNDAKQAIYGHPKHGRISSAMLTLYTGLPRNAARCPRCRDFTILVTQGQWVSTRFTCSVCLAF